MSDEADTTNLEDYCCGLSADFSTKHFTMQQQTAQVEWAPSVASRGLRNAVTVYTRPSSAQVLITITNHPTASHFQSYPFLVSCIFIPSLHHQFSYSENFYLLVNITIMYNNALLGRKRELEVSKEVWAKLLTPPKCLQCEKKSSIWNSEFNAKCNAYRCSSRLFIF